MSIVGGGRSLVSIAEGGLSHAGMATARYTAQTMPVVVAMLRGVNVGGHNIVKMETLRALCEALDCRQPRTYVQSGNVVFSTKQKNIKRLSKDIAQVIEKELGFRPEVILRSYPEMRDIVAKDPFAKRREIPGNKLLVAFLGGEPDPEARDQLRNLKAGPEEFHLGGRELYIYYPNGVGRSKLSFALIERILRTPVTGRNWNTVTKLLEMAEEAEGD